jgi:hypothetical protein
LESSVTTAVAITIVGMTLLFLTLVFFYGLMVLLTAVLKDPQTVAEHLDGDGESEPKQQEALLRAAAIAVVMARAETEKWSGGSTSPAQGVWDGPQPASPWWTYHHQRRLRPDARTRKLP